MDWKSVKKVDKESEGNGIWLLLLTMALGNQPGHPQKPDEKTTQNLVILIKENQDKIKTLVKQDNWEELIKLLNTKSQEKNVKVDWTKVFSDKETLHGLREVTKIWAEKKGKPIDVMRLIEKATKKTETGSRPGARPIGPKPSKRPGEHPYPEPSKRPGEHPHPKPSQRPEEHPHPKPSKRPGGPEEAPKETKERKEVIIKVIQEHNDHIRKLVKEGDWETLVQLLNQKSKK